MKKLLKSLMVIGLGLGTLIVSTQAYFTTTVDATDNQIVTGTLTLAVYSTALHTYSGAPGNGYLVVEDLNGVNTLGTSLEAWTNAEPGVYAAYGSYAGTTNNNGADAFQAGNNSVWFGIVNTGSLPLQYQFSLDGAWSTGARFGTASCPADGASANKNLVSIQQVRRFANGGAVPGCQNQEECQNVREHLESMSRTGVASTGADLGAQTLGSEIDSAAVTLAAGEYQMYRVDFNLDPATDNCYQGATYLYDLSVDGKQVLAPSF